ncbi:anaerobic dehydrogenase, typically selenocysteine-containing [Desulfosporosinus orientis DSM 765]|uniref:Anaerobic dehydrogenase, typically selenocysteine-containing n=1 Tax=Desulfosporosinus orientis (strain ATCC 19365 / DSM 765 / NCIMB 8382 / VKM B-1628 / Singapore I) TaxID=768706 RepID=G7WAB6_DESOD|nr:molybdopterin-dependent oxidoreductase [Desulfosporosinus orientis]AET66465.1 anaerobic dehydrogenase, typically selenocysteine-containing [Desulfosporosinus orientis DSM 765]
MNLRSKVVRSVCPYDCPDACGLLIEVIDGQAVKVTGDPEHPFTRGTLCPKMAHYERTVHSPHRITQPLARTGEKGTGQYKPISWDEGVERIVSTWKEIISQYGAEAILPYSYAGTMGMVQRNCGEGFFYRLGASRLDRTICSSSKGYGWSAVMGETLAPHPDEVGKSDFIILWSTNALATNIHLLNYVREAKKRGAVVWLIDTYENPTARLVDKVVLVRPGRDAALALGMMHILASENLLDQSFISSYVQGFEELRREVLPDYFPEKVCQITGIEEGLLRELALYYGKARAPFIALGSGLCRYGNGAMTVRAITCLPAIIGAWNKPGGGLLVSTSTGKAFPTDKITRKDLLTKSTRMVNMNQLGSALTELSYPPIKSLYVYHSNPAVVAPDQRMIIKGLMREDLFTVVHERFMTNTAGYADIILPATSSLEHSDIYRSYGHYGIQKAAAVIPPVGEAKSNWEVFQLLAQALGFTESYFKQTTEDLIEGLIDPPTEWLAGVELKKLRGGYPVELPLPGNYKTRFLTPSGKIEIYNPKETEPLPYYFAPYEDDAPFYLMSAPSLYSLNSSFNERPDLLSKKKGPCLLMNPRDAEDKKLLDGQRVIAFNVRGEARFSLKITEAVPQGVVVTEGLYFSKNIEDSTVNALTSQRLTDKAAGSTLYDVKVDVRNGEGVKPTT